MPVRESTLTKNGRFRTLVGFRLGQDEIMMPAAKEAMDLVDLIVEKRDA